MKIFVSVDLSFLLVYNLSQSECIGCWSNQVNQSGPIPAHLTGNLWNQRYSIPDIVNPYSGLPSVDITNALKKQFGNNVTALLEHCVEFYYNLGFAKLPESFWKYSEIEEPAAPWQADCHGTAHSLAGGDIRLSMCGTINTGTCLPFFFLSF